MQTSNMGNQQMSQSNNIKMSIPPRNREESVQLNKVNNNQNNIQQNSMWQGNMAPGAVIGTRKNIKLIEQYDFSKYGLRVEIMEYQELLGSTNIYEAQYLWFMKEVNIKCRQIAIYILNSGAKIEAGAMSYFQGPLEATSGLDSLNKIAKQFLTSKFTKEKFAMPEYKGSGILVLEPSFKHFITLELEQGESIICDKGMFYAASLGVEIQPCFAGGVSGSLLGGEGILQQMITGPGMVILESPVPMCEINQVKLNNDILRVDGNFALLRSTQITMNVETVTQNVIGSAISGEGLVNVYRGTGEVWLAPTIKAYDGIKAAKAVGGNLGNVDFNTSTGNTKTVNK